MNLPTGALVLKDETPRTGHRTVVRSRLTEGLDQILEERVGLVSGPAGAGKTTLLSSWAGALQDAHVAWVTCREVHNDPVVLIEAIRAAAAPALIIPPNTPLGGLCGAVVAARPRRARIVLVLDDAHVLRAPAVLEAVDRLIDERPASLCVVVSGREEPHLAWHKARLRGLVELRPQQLAFDVAEAGQLLSWTFGMSLPPEQVLGLCEATEGLAAGLCLAGLAMRDSGLSPSNGVERMAAHPYVSGFLEAEVLGSMPDDHVRFLEITSLLDQLDPELCDELTGRHDSAALLTSFVERNLFTQRISQSPPRFEYHALMVRYLRDRAERRPEMDRPALLAIASSWYERRGLSDAAIATALALADDARAERLIRAACGPAIQAGLAATVVRWITSLRAETIERSPELTLALARASAARGDLLMAQAALQAVSRTLGSDGDAAWLRLGLLHLDILVRILEGAVEGIADEVDGALETVRRVSDSPQLAMLGIDEEALTVYGAVGSLITGELDRAVATIDSVLTPARLTYPTKATVLAVGVRALALTWSGDDTAAAETLRAGSHLVAGFRGTTGDPLAFHLASVWASDAGGEGPSLTDARDIVRELAFPLYELLLALTEARAALRRGQNATASNALAVAWRMLETMPGVGFLAGLARDLQSELEALEGRRLDIDLHPREIEVLRQMATGATRREAAEHLHLSLNTVKTYLRTAYRKLEATSRDDAVARARRYRLL